MSESYGQKLKNGKVQGYTTTITSGTTTSEIDLKGGTLVAVILPAGLSSTQMKISASSTSGGTYANIIDGLGQYGTLGGDLTFTIAASKILPIPPSITAGFRYIKLLPQSTETNATLTYLVRNFD